MKCQVDLIVPEEVYDTVHKKLIVESPAPVFQRVIMTLGDVLTGEFFKEYIELSMKLATRLPFPCTIQLV